MASITGTANNDSLNGTQWMDWIDGQDGNDVLYGYAGNDQIYGGNGFDYLYGGEGDDQLFGSGTPLPLDEILADGGNYVDGGAGNDYIIGGDDADTLLGGVGDDTLYGRGGSDDLQGGAGNDYLNGGMGNDVLNGGAGNDLLYAGGGNDQLLGGVGDDTDTYVVGVGSNIIKDADDTNSIDTVQFQTDGNLIWTRSGLDLKISGYGGVNDSTTITDYFNHYSSAYRKQFSFMDRQFSLQYMQMNKGTQWNDSSKWIGTGANNLIYASNLADYISGYAGNDFLYGYLGDDSIFGGAGGDTLIGGGGSDLLYGGDGDDSDTYLLYSDSGLDQIIDTDDLLAIDRVSYGGVASTQVTWERDGLDLGILVNGSGDGVVIKNYFNYAQNAHRKLFSFSDKTFTLKDMQSGTRRFVFYGTAAGETLNGSNIADLIYGFNGNDIINGYDGNDVLQGGLGNDSLYGHAGNDGLNGNEGNDVLGGGAGDDVLYGGTSNDTDLYLFHIGAGKDVVIDTDDTTTTDSLRFSNINSADATFSKSGNDLIVKYGAGNDQVTVKQFYDASVKAGRKQFQFSNETITAAQVPALLQQAQALKAAVAGLSSKESAIAVQTNTVNNTVNLVAAV